MRRRYTAPSFERYPYHWLLGILILGALLRFLFVAHPGYSFDVTTNQGWAESAATLGVIRSYTEQVGDTMLPNYPPLSLMIFGVTGMLYETAGGIFDTSLVAWRAAIKTPAIFADLLTAILLFLFVNARWKKKGFGLLAALIYVVHPAVIYESAVWGQTDAIYTLFSFAAIFCAVQRWWFGIGMFAMLAVLTKLQAIAFFPLLGLLLLSNPRHLFRACIGAASVAAVILFPFSQHDGWQRVLDMYSGLLTYYPKLANGAYNFWWMLFADDAGSITVDTVFIGFLDYRVLGFILVGIFYVFFLALFLPSFFQKKGVRRTDAIVLAATGMSAAFFLFNVQMHERYLFPFYVVGLPLVFLGTRFAIVYIAISSLSFLNLLGILPSISVVRFLYDTFPTFDVAIASGLVFCFFYYCIHIAMLRYSK